VDGFHALIIHVYMQGRMSARLAGDPSSSATPERC
jgi:hypothetical protein